MPFVISNEHAFKLALKLSSLIDELDPSDGPKINYNRVAGGFLDYCGKVGIRKEAIYFDPIDDEVRVVFGGNKYRSR